MKNLDDLVQSILDARFESIDYDREKVVRRVGEYQGEGFKNAVKTAVYEWAEGQETISQMSARIGELEAKVMVYEEIIKKSNFALAVSDVPNADGLIREIYDYFCKADENMEAVNFHKMKELIQEYFNKQN